MNVPWANGERVKGFLNISLISLEPTLGSIVLDIFTPYSLVTMDRITWDAEDRALCKMLVHDRQSSLRNNSGETKSGRRVQS